MHRVISLSLLMVPLVSLADGNEQINEEFNTDFINGRFNQDAVTKALNSGLNEKAIYSVQINGKTVGDIYFTRQAGRLHFDEAFYNQHLAPLLTPPLREKLHQAMALELQSTEYTITEKPASSTLSIWFHDKDMQNADDALMPLTNTINSLVVNYNMSPGYFADKDSDDKESTLPANGHIRLDLNHFRFNLDLSSADLVHDNLDTDNASVSRLLPALRSELTAGQTYTNSRYSEGYNFYGVRLSSVDDLFSRRDRDYTPDITGYARTNATVEVYQGKRLLYTKTVAAGPFVINEVQGLSNQTLRVVVKESDGTQNTFYYENTVVPGLLTPGAYSYQFNSGKYRYGDNHSGEAFASAEYSRGFSWLTGTLNGLVSGDYRSMTLGGSLPLRTLGALGLAVSNSDYHQAGHHFTGQSYSINYAKYLSNSVNLQLAGYRYSTRGYLSFNDAMEMKRSGLESYSTLRNRFTASLMAKEPLLNNQLSLNITRSSYWSSSPTTTTYSVNYGGYVQRISYSLSAAKSYTEDFDNETSLSLTLTIPFGEGGKSVYTRYNNSRYTNTTEVGLNGYNQNSSYAVSASRDFENNNSVVNGAYAWNTDRYSSQLSASYSTHAVYAAGSVNGSLAFADGHMVASNSQATTLALVKFDGAKHASVNGVSVQKNGYALVPLNDQYDEQNVSVDTESLANNIQLKDGQVRIRPRYGEMTRVRFTGKKVKYVRAILKDAQGKPLSFGSELIRVDTGEVLFAGNGGGVLLQKALASGKNTQDLVLQKTDSGCLYRIPARTLINISGETQDFIDAGELACQNP